MLSRINHITSYLLLKPSYRIVRHSLLQLAVLLITVNILWDEPVRILPDRFLAWGIYIALINVTIYINMYLLVPNLLLKGKTKGYLGLTFSLIFFFVISVGILQAVSDGESVTTNRTPAVIGILSGFASFGLFIAGLTNLQLFKYLSENRRRINQLENATMSVELANLQNQVNPHFLFNMLNNANVMAGEDADKSSYILSKLNDLLRYQVEKGSEKTVKLKDDVTLIRDYLELEKLRRDRFNFRIHLEGNIDIELPPLLFIPFVENAVKHNPENDSYVEIVLLVTSDKLHFECRNPKAKSYQIKKEGGIGLVNIKRRLDLLFKRNYSLTLKDEEESYTAIMELKYDSKHNNLNYKYHSGE